MTPKEKAEKIYNSFQNEIEFSFCDSNRETHVLTVMCALIAVNEIEKVVYLYNDTNKELTYWQQVKTEIEKL